MMRHMIRILQFLSIVAILIVTMEISMVIRTRFITIKTWTISSEFSSRSDDQFTTVNPKAHFDFRHTTLPESMLIELANQHVFPVFPEIQNDAFLPQPLNPKESFLHDEKANETVPTTIVTKTRKTTETSETTETIELTETSEPAEMTTNNPLLEFIAKPGTDAYYALDIVRQRLINKTKSAAQEMLVSLEKSLKMNVSEKRNVTRAILTYLPINMDGYAKEVKALYLSLAVMRLSQPANIKTDMIIFTPKKGIDYPLAFGCVLEVRQSFEDNERCIVIEHLPTKERPLQNDGAPDPLLGYANYLDSILILAEFKHISLYDFVMRVDLDTFLTPGFADWLPPNMSTIMVGKGGYGSENANAHLKWVSTDRLGLNDSGLNGLGSTWYGPTELMVSTAKTAIAAMRWLDTQEFNKYEKCCSGVSGWPFWHWPVILLYGGHIALNQLQSQNIQLSETGVAEMDSGSTSTDQMNNTIKHIHCWHTEEMFSKFAFHKGNYSETKLHGYLNMTSPRDYSSVIAISSERLSNEEMKAYISDPNLMKEKKWIRADPIPPKNQTQI